MMPLAFTVAGPLADQIFEPLFSLDGLFTGSLLARIVGLGPGRGMGFMLMVSGVILLVSSFYVYSRPPIRKLEEEISAYVGGD